MKFSIIIPSYLGPYPGAAKNREEKLFRAINSCLAQSFTDFEVIVVADGCDRTMELLSEAKCDQLKVFKINRKKIWSGSPRNKGIDEAQGEFISYLDIDDMYGEEHLSIINANLNGYDWVWYNDIRYKVQFNYWFENQCDIRVLGRHGTSNICHRADLGLRWDEVGRYAHDYYFTRKLLPITNFTKIQTPFYYVCHVPGTKSSGGYDL